MSNPRYPEEFKVDAVKKLAERDFLMAEIPTRMSMSTHCLHAWDIH